ASDATLAKQREAATVCLEGWVQPSELVVTRSLPRSRLPPLRCDVRLFLRCRCLPITGPQWSRLSLAVDLRSLPRQMTLPLPVPRQLSCAELQQLGIPSDYGTSGSDASGKELGAEDFWALLSIPAFSQEFSGAKLRQTGEDLLELDGPHATSAHYVLQYRKYDQEVEGSSSDPAQEHNWHEVPDVKLVPSVADKGESDVRVFLAAGLDPELVSREPGQAAMVTFRLGSCLRSHFGFASQVAPVSPLPPPSSPGVAAKWVDSPALDGVRVRATAQCDKLSLSYQMRFRLSSADPADPASWVIHDESPLARGTTGEEQLRISAPAPVHMLAYHSEYCFGLRVASLTRFSLWSEDSAPFRLSLEHNGMCPKESRAADALEHEEVSAEEARGLEVVLLGRQERYISRCAAADVSWPPLVFSPGVYGNEAPELTIEYRLRWRRKVARHNDSAALCAVLEELRASHPQGDEWCGEGQDLQDLELDAITPVRLCTPDPDHSLQDIAGRGYAGDITKQACGRPDFTPWQLGAIVPAQASGSGGVDRCVCALTFLQLGCEYEVAVDWRWRRIGDVFWMPAYPSHRFEVPSCPQPPPVLRPLPVLPEVWDRHLELRELGNYALFQWPFARPPVSRIFLAPKGQGISDEVLLDPASHCDFAVQCRPRGPWKHSEEEEEEEADGVWVTCEASFMLLSGKAACLVQWPRRPAEAPALVDISELPEPLSGLAEAESFAQSEASLRSRLAEGAASPEVRRTSGPAAAVSHGLPVPAARSNWHAKDEPRPEPTPAFGELGADELEFRLVRSSDCEVSPGLACAILAPPAPEGVSCCLKMLRPHSTLALLLRFRGLATEGYTAAPREYQVMIQEIGPGQAVLKERLLPPMRLPLERVAEAYPGARELLDFLGAQEPPTERGELGEDFAAARSGGEVARQLGPLEFEHLLSFRELCYGKRYRLAVRWLTLWRVSDWSSTAEARIQLAPPSAQSGSALQVKTLEPLELPVHLAVGGPSKGGGSEEADATFQPPALACRAELCWPPFRVQLWGGGRMEYQLERRCLLCDRRADTGGAAPRSDEGQLEATPWELVGSVLTEIEDATGEGVRPAGDHLTEEAPLEEVAQVFLQELYSRLAAALGSGRADAKERKLQFQASELLPSNCYQFRLRARLLFHPASGHESEWSAPLDSDWHRTDLDVQEPSPPREAVAPDPPPPELLEDGSTLLVFDHLPIRELERPSGCALPPAPYTLQVRGATASEEADWLPVDSRPLGGDDIFRFIVNSQNLQLYFDSGAVFRLWRCLSPEGSSDGPHSKEKDARVRHFSGLASVPSKPIAVRCSHFARPPTVSLVYALNPDLARDRAVKEEAAEDCEVASRFEDPPPSLNLRFDWSVKVPGNSALASTQRHQVRYRRVRPAPAAEWAERWQALEPFEQPTDAHSADVRHELPVAGPRFLFGADYEASVRMGTQQRWGDWCLPVPVSLAVRPPQPSPSGKLTSDFVHLQDGTRFFKLSWPAFRPHPLCVYIEYRIRMTRITRYRWADRLSKEMLERSEESMAAQQRLHVVGTIRRRVPRSPGPVPPDGDVETEEPPEMMEFVYDVAADPECGYQFFVDAKHEHCSELQSRLMDEDEDEEILGGEGEKWSQALESRELVAPPMARNWFVPEQVPLEVVPAVTGQERLRLRAPFPMSLGESSIDSLKISDPTNHVVLVFAPWNTAAEASRWPHRLEYSPYLPSANPGRLMLPGDISEDVVEWHTPSTIQYISEDREHDSTYLSPDDGPSAVDFAVVSGFDYEIWDKEIARLGVDLKRTQALGLFVRIRCVREGGPECMQLASNPSKPIQLCVPAPSCGPSVAVWCAAGRFVAILWWPSIAAEAAGEDKNLDFSTHLHQVRMRRPMYDLDAGWIVGPTQKTVAPVMLPKSDDSGMRSLHAWDLCQLFDESMMPEELLSEAIPPQPTGALPDSAPLTFEFCVRVSNGCRWSEWSPESDPVSFAREPGIVADADYQVRELGKLLKPGEDTVCPARQVDPELSSLRKQLTDLPDGEVEPPRWVSVSRPPKPSQVHGMSIMDAAAAATARMTQFVVSWPNFPPHVFSEPEVHRMPVLESLVKTGALPEYQPPLLVYRLNVWLVGSAPDAAPIMDLPEPVPTTLKFGSQNDLDAGGVIGNSAEAASTTASANGDVLYRQFDLPPSAFTDVPDGFDGDMPPASSLSWVLPALLPDRTFRCSVEARFQTLTGMEWWTPLMQSGEFVTERVPPPPPPEIAPICELGTPEYQKLASRTVPGSSAFVVVRWPWSVDGKPLDLLRNASHVLEYCTSTARPGLRDPTTKPAATAEGETALAGRPLGPWREAKAQQIWFANFETNKVFHEMPFEARYEANWVPVLVASGLYVSGAAAAAAAPSAEEGECDFVHLRWRYRASPADIAVTPAALHFSAATLPVRTRVASPVEAPLWKLGLPDGSSRLGAWLTWHAWSGATRHQFSFRVLHKKRRKRHSLLRAPAPQSDSESSAGSQEGRRSIYRSKTSVAIDKPAGQKKGISRSKTLGAVDKPAGQNEELEVVTGWIEVAPITDDIKRQRLHGDAGQGSQELPAAPSVHSVGAEEEQEQESLTVEPAPTPAPAPADVPPLSEDKLLAKYVRRLPPNEWNSFLWRHYRNQDEFWNPVEKPKYSEVQGSGGSVSGKQSLASGMRSEATARSSRSRSVSRDRRPSGGTRASRTSVSPTGSEASSAAGSGARRSVSEGRRSVSGIRRSISQSRGKRGSNTDAPFRLGPNSFVEWRVRVSDGFGWSGWSPASEPMFIVPPVPTLSSTVHMNFSRREPTIARIAWAACQLEEEYHKVVGSIEYMVYITSDENPPKSFAQEEANFDVEKLFRQGVMMSEGVCGIVEPWTAPKDEKQPPPYDFETLFSDRSERRLVGKFLHRDARPTILSKTELRSLPVSGFELVVSGLKPQCLHRVSVVARCATSGLDEPEWQRLKISSSHPLRWSDPHNSLPLMTPRVPPPLLVPEPIPIPEGRFGRFLHTPVVLVRCPMFRKVNKDDFDKDHKVVIDVRPAGAKDEDYRQVPMENSVYCEPDGNGPCRLIYNLPFMHAEVRARNTTMNDISAATPAFFAVPPLVLEGRRGPKVQLVVGEDGALSVQLFCTTRCLPQQQPRLVQIALRRHAVDTPAVELPSFEITAGNRLEEAPASAVVATGEAFERLVAEAEVKAANRRQAAEEAGPGAAASRTSSSQRARNSCPFVCRCCFRPLDSKASPVPFGPLTQARLANVRSALEDGAIHLDDVPRYRGPDDELRQLRVPHVSEVGQHEGAAGFSARKAPGPCGCRDVYILKELPVDGEQLRHGTTYVFRLRILDGLLWSPWTDFSDPLPVLVPPPRPPLPLQDVLMPAPPPLVEVMLVRDALAVATAASMDHLDGGGHTSDLRLRLRWPQFEGRMQEVEYRVLMWALSPEQRQRASGSRRATDGKGRTGLPPVVGVQTFVTSASFPSHPPVQMDDSGASPRNVRAGEAEKYGPAAGTAMPRAVKSKVASDAPQVIAHIRPFDPPARGPSGFKHTPKQQSRGKTLDQVPDKVSGLGDFLDAEVSVLAVPAGYGYVFAVESKHSRGACGNLGEWSAPLFSKLVEFAGQERHLRVEVDARFGTLLFKGQVYTDPKPANKQLIMEAGAVSFADEHRDLPKAAPLLAQPGGENPWPHGASPTRFVTRSRNRTVYSERLPELTGDAAAWDHNMSQVNQMLEERPKDDDFREH
ncbi:unnamed protein product, partial [Polarella glacialis]